MRLNLYWRGWDIVDIEFHAWRRRPSATPPPPPLAPWEYLIEEGRQLIPFGFQRPALMTRPRSNLRKLQRAGYRCQARTPEGYQCNAPAGQVDRATGVVACKAHLSQTSRR